MNGSDFYFEWPDTENQQFVFYFILKCFFNFFIIIFFNFSFFQSHESRVQGPGSRVQGPGSRVQGPGSRVQGPGSRVQGPGSRVQGSGSRVQGPVQVLYYAPRLCVLNGGSLPRAVREGFKYENKLGDRMIK